MDFWYLPEKQTIKNYPTHGTKQKVLNVEKESVGRKEYNKGRGN